MNNKSIQKLFAAIIVLCLTLTITLPAFAGGISIKNSAASRNSAKNTTGSSDQPDSSLSFTEVLFSNTTPYEIAVTAQDYKQDFNRHEIRWYDENHKNWFYGEKTTIKPGKSAYLRMEMAKYRRNYSFVYRVDFLGGVNDWTTVRFDNTQHPYGRLATLKYGSNREFQISECRFVERADQTFINRMADEIVNHMKISPSSKWYKRAKGIMIALIAKSLDPLLAQQYRYQVAVSLTETVPASAGRNSGTEVRPIFWDDAQASGSGLSTNGATRSGSGIVKSGKIRIR